MEGNTISSNFQLNGRSGNINATFYGNNFAFVGAPLARYAGLEMSGGVSVVII